MPPGRKRRIVEDQQDDEDSSPGGPATQPGPSNRRRRRGNSEQSASSDDGEGDAGTSFTQSTDVKVKKLVRLALACEYARIPIRRNDISQKVLDPGSRQFKDVFNNAQKQLRERFGMEMVEQPLKEKVTISQKRAAQRVEKAPTSSKTWTLTTVLPPEYRTAGILTPSRAPSAAAEGAYIGLYTFVITLITLAGGSIQESRLERSLRRTNIETYTPIGRTDHLLARMCKEGYLMKHRETETGEEVIQYYIGPRGKTEVGTHGVEGLVREVYGFGIGSDEGNSEERTEFESKLSKSLGNSQLRTATRAGRAGDDDDDDD